jgi:dTDP-4-dehydrorhamnose reductase
MLKALIDESNPASVERAVEVNARFPHRLAAAAARRGARLIHVSTDGVFSGHPALLDEGAPADASDVYGRSKRNGEVTGPAALTLRCSIVGPDPVNGRSLYEWLRSRPSGSSVRGFTDQQWNGTTTLQIAELCEQLMDSSVFDAITAVSPLRHCCPNPPVSKYELLCGLRDALGLDVTVESVASGAPSDRTLHSRWTDLNELLPEADWPQLLTALVGADPRGRVAQGVPL